MNSTRILLCIAVAVLIGCEGGSPMESSYAGLESREIKALSPEQLRGYLRGEGMGFAQVAELNHYPGPKHVLAMADRLRLDVTQRQAAEASYHSMKADAERLGALVVEKERELDALFARGRATEPAVDSLLVNLGRLNAELRLVHVRAHISMRQVLSSRQVEMYDSLRGYTEGSDRHSHRGHGS